MKTNSSNAALAIGSALAFLQAFFGNRVCWPLTTRGLLPSFQEGSPIDRQITCAHSSINSYLPFHTGSRFSTKARGPSLLSSVVAIIAERSASKRNPSSSDNSHPL